MELIAVKGSQAPERRLPHLVSLAGRSRVISPYGTSGKPPAGSGTGNTAVADNPPSLAGSTRPVE
jgi:hypothetical protein